MTTTMVEITTTTSSSTIPLSSLVVGMDVDVESRTWPGINKPGGRAEITRIHYHHGHNENEKSSSSPLLLPRAVDVKYVLGGRETQVELAYVRAHVELERGGRSRRRDVKMNASTLGGVVVDVHNNSGWRRKNNKNKKNKKGAGSSPSSPTKAKGGKKRKALADIDDNGNTGGGGGGKTKVAKKKKTKVGAEVVLAGGGNDGPSEKKKGGEGGAAVVASAGSGADAEAGKARADNDDGGDGPSKKKEEGPPMVEETAEGAGEEDGKWTLIEDGKFADYVPILVEGRRVSYWWDTEYGWVTGTVSRPLTRVLTKTSIKWNVVVDFDGDGDGDGDGDSIVGDGGIDRHTLAFHPLDKRWKVFHNNPHGKLEDGGTGARGGSTKPTGDENAKAPSKKSAKKPSMAKKKSSETKESSKTTTKPVAAAAEKRAEKATGAGDVDARGKKSAEEREEEKNETPAAAARKGAPDAGLAPDASAERRRSTNADSREKYQATKKNTNLSADKGAASAGSSRPIPQAGPPAGQQRTQPMTTTTTTTTTAPAFGANLQSKIKEISSKIHTAKKASSSSAAAAAREDDDAAFAAAAGLVNYSPNSILAARAAHARAARGGGWRTSASASASAAAGEASTASIGHGSGLFRPGSDERLPREDPGSSSGTTGARVSLISPPSPGASASRDDADVAAASASASLKSTSGPKTVLQDLYKSERDKAGKFVDYMTTSKKKPALAQSSPPSEDEEADLELKMDKVRTRLFNSVMSDIMFHRPSVDKIDVEELLEKSNAKIQDSLSRRPFTLLEIRPYLQQLHDKGRIFLVKDEGKMGVVYDLE